MAELCLIITYLSVLLIKACDVSLARTALYDADVTEQAVVVTVRAACRTYGFGDDASGEEGANQIHGAPFLRSAVQACSIHLCALCARLGLFFLFIFIGLGSILMLIILGLVRLYYAG
eukprot:1707077-Prymnesium_polylepis.2